MKILVVDDERLLVKGIKFNLENEKIDAFEFNYKNKVFHLCYFAE